MPLSKKRAHLLKQRKVLKILTIHMTIGHDGFLTIRSSQPIGIISSPSSSPRQSSLQLVRSFTTKSFWRWWCIKIKIWTTIKNFRLRKHCPGYLCWASLLHPLCHREIYFESWLCRLWFLQNFYFANALYPSDWDSVHTLSDRRRRSDLCHYRQRPPRKI